MVFKLVFLISIGLSLSLASKWSYEGLSGPPHWHSLFPMACAGTHQSPIDIRAEQTLYDPQLKEFAIWYDPPKPDSKMTLKNNGHSVQVDLSGDFFVSNGGLSHVYRAAQFHFHWGHHVNVGSEHTMEGRASPIEMHLVTWNQERFNNIGEAVQAKGGLAVLGVMFEVANEDNPAFEEIVAGLKHVRDAEKKVLVDIVPLISVRDLLPSDLTRYFRYNGSLTTPGCFESVTWTVFDVKQQISHRQLREFRKTLQFKRHHNNHHGGSRHRRESQPESMAKEEGGVNVMAELGVLGDKFEESMFKETVVEKMQEDVERKFHNHSGSHHQSEGAMAGGEPVSVTPDVPQPTQQIQYVQDILVNNYRPTQPLNGRLVYRSFKLSQPPVVIIETGEGQPGENVYSEQSRGYNSERGHDNTATTVTQSAVSLVTCVLLCLSTHL